MHQKIPSGQAGVSALTDESLRTVLHKIITRMMKLLTCRGVLIEEQGQTYMADGDADSDDARTLRPLQAAPGVTGYAHPGSAPPANRAAPDDPHRIGSRRIR